MKALIALCGALLVASSFSVTRAAPLYRITPLGFDDAEHTNSVGARISRVLDLNEAGQVIGNSRRYNGDGADVGQSAWLYYEMETINIGLTGAAHTRSDGVKYSQLGRLNEAGQVIGYSLHYDGGDTQLGRSAWMYNGTTTIDIGLTGVEPSPNDERSIRTAKYKDNEAKQLNQAGQVIGTFVDGAARLSRSAWLYNGTTTIDISLTDVEHTRNDGYHESIPEYLTESGHVIGRSIRYNGGTAELGYSAWLYDGTRTIDIGLTDAEHTGIDGYKFSIAAFGNPSTHPDHLNEAGQVIGVSRQYNGDGTWVGQSTWLYNGTTTINIGLTGAEHTHSNGGKYSESSQLNEAGQVIGYSRRYDGDSHLGQSAWLYNGTTTVEIGFTGLEHTGNDGYKKSTANQLNEAGQVIGESVRGEGLGFTAWLYNGTTTVDIGLHDIEHTSSSAYKSSGSYRLNEAGQVAGHSRRYNGGDADLGFSAWLYNGTATIDIGLADVENTRNDGYQYSFATQLNEAGQVIGHSKRYNGGSSELGTDAWFYDPVLNQTFPLRLSTRSDGYAYSNVSYFSEDGLVLGYYTLFDALDNDLGYRPFYFSVADGLHDLGSLVDDGLAANGWDYLKATNEFRANGLKQIVGQGKLSSQLTDLAYLLTPVPEPNAPLLASLGALGILARRRIKKSPCLRVSLSAPPGWPNLLLSFQFESL